MKQMSRRDIYALAVLVWLAVGNVCYMSDSWTIELREDMRSKCDKMRGEWTMTHNVWSHGCAMLLRPIALWMEVYVFSSVMVGLTVGLIECLLWVEQRL